MVVIYFPLRPLLSLNADPTQVITTTKIFPYFYAYQHDQRCWDVQIRIRGLSTAEANNSSATTQHTGQGSSNGEGEEQQPGKPNHQEGVVSVELRTDDEMNRFGAAGAAKRHSVFNSSASASGSSSSRQANMAAAGSGSGEGVVDLRGRNAPLRASKSNPSARLEKQSAINEQDEPPLPAINEPDADTDQPVDMDTGSPAEQNSALIRRNRMSSFDQVISNGVG